MIDQLLNVNSLINNYYLRLTKIHLWKGQFRPIRTVLEKVTEMKNRKNRRALKEKEGRYVELLILLLKLLLTYNFDLGEL